jgi:hypothetical protein
MRDMRLLVRLVAIGIVAAAASSNVLARAAGRQAVTVGIVLGGHAPAGARLVPAMVTEADRIWRSRGVEVVPVAKASVPHEDVRLILEFASLSSAPAASRGKKGEATTGLGSIWFDEDGAPGDTITIDDEAVMARIAQTTLNHRPLADWPPGVVDLAMGRALGRVLAHELGHYLLRSKIHQASGLMRAAFSGADLAAWARTRFVLDSSMLPRLRANLARIELLKDPAVATNRQRDTARTPDTDP